MAFSTDEQNGEPPPPAPTPHLSLMAETNNHATVQPQLALTEFTQPDAGSKENESGNVANDIVEAQLNNISNIGGGVHMPPGIVTNNNAGAPFPNIPEAGATGDVIIDIPDDGHNTLFDNNVGLRSRIEFCRRVWNTERIEKRLWRIGAGIVAYAVASIVRHSPEGLFSHQIKAYYITDFIIFIIGMVLMIFAKWIARSRFGDAIVWPAQALMDFMSV
uniref:Uncharacterized protein n=1 Tax=Leersia perrieri TaxID=77586 RepID=A0A0D9X5C9_9ORYZ